MNQKRRLAIADIVAQLRVAQENFEPLKDQEQEAFDNMPESFRDGEKGEKAQEILDCLDSAYDALQEALEQLEECISK